MILAMSNRSGGKTTDFAIIALLKAMANDNCEVANIGAIETQAQRCYRYMQEFISRSLDFKSFLAGTPTISKTDFINRSLINVLVATVNGVNSPHPQALLMDEVELFNWFILQQAFNMPQSRGDAKSQTIMGSTRKYATGPMQRMIKEKDAMGIHLYQWCVWEVVEKLPTDNPDLMARIKKTFGEELPEHIGRANGFYKWEDLISKFEGLDREIWETEWLSLRPQGGGLVYPKFSDTENVTMDWKFNAGKQHYIFEDLGYALDHPDVLLLAEIDPSRNDVVVFDELYLTLKSTAEIKTEAEQLLAKWGLTMQTINGWIPDPHGLTEVRDRYNFGAPILYDIRQLEKVQGEKLYRLENSIPLVRKFIDMHWFKITPNCVNLQGEFHIYAKRRLPDGTYTDDPVKTNDHGPSAVRYGLIKLFPLQAYASIDVIHETQFSSPPQEGMITAGLLDKKF